MLVDTFDFGLCKIKSAVEETLDGIFGLQDIAPAEDEADKLDQLLPAQFQLFPDLRTCQII